MSIQTIYRKIQLIGQYKQEIKNAIKAKGVNVADSDKLEVYASKIALIEQNSGGAEPSSYISVDDAIEGNYPSIVNYTGSGALKTYLFSGAHTVEFNLPNIIKVGSYTFRNCKNAVTINLPAATIVDVYGIANCSSLKNLNLQNVVTISNYGLAYCDSIEELSLPKVSILTNSAVRECYSLKNVFLSNCSQLSSSAFANCYNLMSITLMYPSVVSLGSVFVFASTPLRGYWNSSYASSIKNQYGSIYVPMSLVNQYKQSTNWTYYSDRIVGI